MHIKESKITLSLPDQALCYFTLSNARRFYLSRRASWWERVKSTALFFNEVYIYVCTKHRNGSMQL